MKRLLVVLCVLALLTILIVPFVACTDEVLGSEDVEDMVGRTVSVTPGSYERVVCIGAGALRLYSYIGDVSKLAAVEDIDNTTAEGRPAMFDGVARPYQIAFKETFDTLPSCGKGGPQAQYAEDEKILSVNPDIVISEYEDAEKANTLQEKLGIPVIVVKYGYSGVFDEKIAGSLKLLGKIFDKEENAETLVNFINSQKEAIAQRVKDIDVASQKKVYICGLGQWGTTNELWTAQNYAPFNVAKINNVVTDLTTNGIQEITQEKLVALSSDIDIIIFDAAAVKNIKNRIAGGGAGNMLETSKAWADGEVYLQMAYNAYYTNVEIALINTWYYGKVVYPDLFSDIDIEAKTTEITTAFLGKDLNAAIKAKPLSYGGYQKINTATIFA